MAVLNHCPEMGVISGTEQFPGTVVLELNDSRG